MIPQYSKKRQKSSRKWCQNRNSYWRGDEPKRADLSDINLGSLMSAFFRSIFYRRKVHRGTGNN